MFTDNCDNTEKEDKLMAGVTTIQQYYNVIKRNLTAK